MVQLNKTNENNFPPVYKPKADEILFWYIWPSGDLFENLEWTTSENKEIL